jgi:hypothetical protein
MATVEAPTARAIDGEADVSDATRSPLAGILVRVVILALPLVCGVSSLVSNCNRKADEHKEQQRYAAAPAPEVLLASPSTRPAKLALPAYPAGTIATDGTTWPRACSLLTDDDLRTFLPQAQQIKHTGEARSLTFDTKEYHPAPIELGTTTLKDRQLVAVPEQSCRVSFWLPHKSRTGGTEGIASLTVSVIGAGDPAIVSGFGLGHYLSMSVPEAEFAKANGARGCTGVPVPTYTCTKGALTLVVDGRLNSMDADVPTVHIAGQPMTAGGASLRYQEKVIPSVMAYLLSRIP